ncbi:MAG: hypothetical protein IPN80_01240 [Flavobacterium sp.]|nr:hypothetical protein [Flavobacterium sp.]
MSKYDLQPLTAPFSYYTGPGGTGTMYTGLDINETTFQVYKRFIFMTYRILYRRKHF